MSKYWKAVLAAAASAVMQVPLPDDVPVWLRLLSVGVTTAAVGLGPANKPAAQ